jgi:hypothetical protein
MARESFHIRGQERFDLVDDLAHGEKHADLATKYDRSVDAIKGSSNLLVAIRTISKRRNGI